MGRGRSFGALLGLSALAPSLSGCGLAPFGDGSLSERDCMTRVMYFESNRSSEAGMTAVGTTVMNRITSGRYPSTVCGVVGQPGQFAEGALKKPMNRREAQRIGLVADRVLAGERNSDIGGAMFFHTAGLTFPYTNMHYTAVAGGNAFYEKRSFARRELPTDRFAQARPSRPAEQSAVAMAGSSEPRSIDDLLDRPTSRKASREMAAAATSEDFNGRY